MIDNKVAVLLAMFNGQQWIAEQVISVCNQISVDVTLVVSDDESTDDSLSILLNLESELKTNIQFLNKFASCGGAGQNFFYLLQNVDLSPYDYIALSDQDDIWDSDKLKTAIATIADSNVDAYSSNVTACWSDNRKKLINKSQKQRDYDYMFESAGPGCTFVLTKEVAVNLQAHLIKHKDLLYKVALHDWFIYAFARFKGYKWYIDPNPHMLYRQHGNNEVGANVGLLAMLNRWRKLRQGWLLAQAVHIASIHGYEKSWPMERLKRFNILDRCILALNANKFRRRLRDQLIFAISLFFIRHT